MMRAIQLSDMQTVTPGPYQLDFSFPRNEIEIYQLAIFLETILMDKYQNLIQLVDNSEDVFWLRKLIEFQEQESSKLEKNLKFELNCEISRFHESGGIVEIESLEKGYLENDLQLIYDAFEAFQQEIDRSSWDGPMTLTVEKVDRGKRLNLFMDCLRGRDSARVFFLTLA